MQTRSGVEFSQSRSRCARFVHMTDRTLWTLILQNLGARFLGLVVPLVWREWRLVAQRILAITYHHWWHERLFSVTTVEL
jgi:hypothetical protein